MNRIPEYQIDIAHENLLKLVELLDDSALEDLFSGYSYDVDKLIKEFVNQTVNVYLFNQRDTQPEDFYYLDNFIEAYEEGLRKTSLNYFVSSVLEDFQLNWHNIEWFNLIEMYSHLAILAARGHSKSFTFSYAYPLWNLYRYDPKLAIINPKLGLQFIREGMIITNKSTLASSFIKRIGKTILSNDLLKEKLKPVNGKGFSADELEITTGAKINISSFYTSNRGPHPGWIVVDDFLDRSSIYSAVQREKFKEAFYGEVLPMLRSRGNMIVVGTPFHQKDLYSDFKDTYKRGKFKLFEYPAIMPNGELLWESEYNMEWLRNQRTSQGNLIFTREYLIKPVSDSSSIFPWKTLELAFVGMQTTTLINHIDLAKQEYKRIGVGVDFAISENIGADYTVLCVIGLDKLDRYNLLHIRRLHGASANEQIANIIQVNKDFRPDVIMCESNNFQKVLIDELKTRGLTNVKGWVTTGWNKKDLYSGLPSLAILLEQHRLKFPRGNEDSKNKTDIICNELNSISFVPQTGKLESVGDHDDTAMSIFFGIKSIGKVNSIMNIGYI